MNIKKLNEELDQLLEANYGTGNTTLDMLELIKPGVYINRGQSEVCHNKYPNNWQYFGPYLEPKDFSYSGLDIENIVEYNNEQKKEFNIEATFSHVYITVIGQLVKTWEEFEYEEDNIHHFYHEEYRILEVKSKGDE